MLFVQADFVTMRVQNKHIFLSVRLSVRLSDCPSGRNSGCLSVYHSLNTLSMQLKLLLTWLRLRQCLFSHTYIKKQYADFNIKKIWNGKPQWMATDNNKQQQKTRTIPALGPYFDFTIKGTGRHNLFRHWQAITWLGVVQKKKYFPLQSWSWKTNDS